MSELLVRFVSFLAWVLYIAIIGRVIISWLNVPGENPIVGVVYQITEPILRPLRNVLPSVGMLDFSPIVAIILITVVQRVIKGLAS